MDSGFDKEISLAGIAVAVLVVLALVAHADTPAEDEGDGNIKYRVTYERFTQSSSLSAHVDDGETHTFFFTGEVHNLTKVTIEINYLESEEYFGAGGLCDDVDASVGVPDSYDEGNSTTSGSQTDCNAEPDIRLVVVFDNDFAWDGEDIFSKAETEDELREELTLDRATGEWQVNVTVQVNDGSLVTDSGEDIDVSFVREYYEVKSVKRLGGLL